MKPMHFNLNNINIGQSNRRHRLNNSVPSVGLRKLNNNILYTRSEDSINGIPVPTPRG